MRWLSETLSRKVEIAAEIAGALVDELPMEPVAAMEAVQQAVG